MRMRIEQIRKYSAVISTIIFLVTWGMIMGFLGNPILNDYVGLANILATVFYVIITDLIVFGLCLMIIELKSREKSKVESDED